MVAGPHPPPAHLISRTRRDRFFVGGRGGGGWDTLGQRICLYAISEMDGPRTWRGGGDPSSGVVDPEVQANLFTRREKERWGLHKDQRFLPINAILFSR
jgi:hypothetical protein